MNENTCTITVINNMSILETVFNILGGEGLQNERQYTKKLIKVTVIKTTK